MYRKAVLLTALLVSSWPAAAAPDAPGSQDYPGIGRLEGACIKTYRFVEFDEFTIATAPVTGNADESGRLTLEGKVTTIVDGGRVALHGIHLDVGAAVARARVQTRTERDR